MTRGCNFVNIFCTCTTPALHYGIFVNLNLEIQRVTSNLHVPVNIMHWWSPVDLTPWQVFLFFQKLQVQSLSPKRDFKNKSLLYFLPQNLVKSYDNGLQQRITTNHTKLDFQLSLFSCQNDHLCYRVYHLIFNTKIRKLSALNM